MCAVTLGLLDGRVGEKCFLRLGYSSKPLTTKRGKQSKIPALVIFRRERHPSLEANLQCLTVAPLCGSEADGIAWFGVMGASTRLGVFSCRR